MLVHHLKHPQTEIEWVNGTQSLERQRRAKDARGEEAPLPQAESSEPPMLAPSSPLLQAERMAGRVVTMGRWINFQFFDENGFAFIEWIRRQS